MGSGEDRTCEWSEVQAWHSAQRHRTCLGPLGAQPLRGKKETKEVKRQTNKPGNKLEAGGVRDALGASEETSLRASRSWRCITAGARTMFLGEGTNAEIKAERRILWTVTGHNVPGRGKNLEAVAACVGNLRQATA